ncbi:glycerol kinase GlpK [Gulosibacter chungangensis]|uniref:Glycerol kinase n=1 Tax=Gulosibacter chungangensis TaxID=979746 RepID=A0A7J5B8I2_9MICO|nr:glycerol kinase GlpK [Gulosibacter chungangensis]KAB1641660.1 glycerol kinase GlpK [Gulosibacter chungangensis]
MADYILSLDQGTTSTRAIVFDRAGSILATAQREHTQYFPQPGWVEHDADEIWRNARNCIGLVLADAQLTATDIVAVGITNQRETTICWDRKTGKPLHPAIVWQDTRTQEIVDRIAEEGAEQGGVDRFRERTGLPLNAYFTATKIAWLLEHVERIRERAERGEVLFGTVDSWLTWHLTGGPNGGVHITDVTNASRSLLMRLDTCQWDDELLEAFDIPRACLPEIRSSSEVYGRCSVRSPLPGVPVAGILGDQQAATFGQAAFDMGEAKNTYGTGSFLVYGTGTKPVQSEHGLLTTVAYRLGDGPTHYALEGSIAVTGSLVQWLRDNLGMIKSSAEIEPLAQTVEDNGGCYIVPAFSGLYAPWWRPDARGVIVGLTRFINKGHIARAALESTAFQSADVLDACNADAPEPLTELRVDGGMTVNDSLMQFQADVLGVPVVRPVVTETTALGAAFVAGLAVGFWSGLDELRSLWQEDRRFYPSMPEDAREALRGKWREAVSRSFDLA